jgi:hypothetical protein
MIGRNKLVALISSATLAIGLGGTAAVLWSGTATAVSTTHKATKIVNNSSAFEPKAKASFSCNTSTNQFTLKLTNVQVVQDDHIKPWPNSLVAFAWGTFNVLSPLEAHQNTQMTQNPKTELFGATITGTMLVPAACFSGATFQVVDNGGNGWLNLTGTLK